MKQASGSLPWPAEASRRGVRGQAGPVLPERLHAALPVVIAGGWALLIEHVDVRNMTDLGLISVLPIGVILLLFLLTASFCLSLARRPLIGLVPLVHVVVLIVMLYGITSFVESEPRVGIIWKHVGVIDYIIGHGRVDPKIDAFFNWPGFFALGALITKAAGFQSALAFANWGPLFFNLLFLAPLVMIFRWASDDRRVTWLGLWIFYSTNWVTQDHIAPQAVGYTLWLAILAALLTWFTPRPAAFVGRLSVRRLLPTRLRWTMLKRAGRQPPPVGSVGQRVGILVLVVALYGAIVTGHQLTPIPALITVTGLVVVARLQIRSLPVIMTVLLAAWISYMTTAYLVGNSSVLTGPLGQVSGNLSQSVTSRLGGSPEHQFIVNIRLVGTAAIWLLALGGFVRRLHSRYFDAAMGVVAAGSFLLPALQPYGGEILLRVFLFALPGVSFAIAALAFPSIPAGRSWWTAMALIVVGCALLGLFQYTRYGNERLDNFTTGDVATAQAFYRLAPPGSVVYAGYDNIPMRYERYIGYDYRLVSSLPQWNTLHPSAVSLAAHLQAALAAAGGGYVIVTRSTEIEASLFSGKPHVLERLVQILRADRSFRELYRNPDGDLFYLAGSKR